MLKTYNVAIVGPLGAVGRQVASLLAERNFPINKISLLGTENNRGKEVIFKDEIIYTEVASKEAFKEIDLAFFCVGNEVSKSLAPIAIEEGAIVIDNSSAWRMDPDVPLVIPEVNPEAVDSHNGLISNPNCSTIQMLVALKPVHDAYQSEESLFLLIRQFPVLAKMQLMNLMIRQKIMLTITLFPILFILIKYFSMLFHI